MTTLTGGQLGDGLARAVNRRYGRAGAVRRRHAVLVEIIGAVLWCLGGFALLIDTARRAEVALATGVLELAGVDRISGALGDSFIVFGPNGQPVVAELTASCSALTSLLALSALAVVVLRERVQAGFGFGVAALFVLAANQARLIASLLAGRYLDVDALVFFHDWVGALLTFAYTLIGLLIMIHLTMHDAEQAEQDSKGRHTAARPTGWARPGLGYRMLQRSRPRRRRIRLAAVMHRLVPWQFSDRIAERRERGRVDYRVGHLDAAARAEAIRRLAGRGLGVHTATLIAVAAHETDPLVLDALAESVAARQWEPVSHPQIAGLRLWARAWLMRSPAARTRPETARRIAVTGAGGPAGVAVIRALRAAGEDVLALDAHPDAVGLRLAGNHVVVPRADAPGFAEALLKAVATHRPVALICTVAEEYAALVPLADRLAALGCRTWLPDLAAAETCLDKVAFAAAMRAAGVPHPSTATTPATAAITPGPWVVKPARGRGSRDVVYAATPDELVHAFATVPGAIAQSRLDGREFTADVLIDRNGTLLTCVPRWREETKAGISVRGRTFDSAVVTEVVAATVAAVGLTGPANVQGFVGYPDLLDGDPDAPVKVTVVEVNPRFSGGLPLTLAAGADVVGTYLTGILAPQAPLPRLTFEAGVRMARHFAEVFYAADGSPVADPSSAVPNLPADAAPLGTAAHPDRSHDTGLPGAGLPDTGLPDAGQPDAGQPGAGRSGGRGGPQPVGAGR